LKAPGIGTEYVWEGLRKTSVRAQGPDLKKCLRKRFGLDKISPLCSTTLGLGSATKNQKLRAALTKSKNPLYTARLR
jgi:hypothetical protein